MAAGAATAAEVKAEAPAAAEEGGAEGPAVAAAGAGTAALLLPLLLLLLIVGPPATVVTAAGAAAPAPAPPAGPLAVAEECSLNPKTRGTYLACGSGGGGLAPGYVSSRRCGQVVPK